MVRKFEINPISLWSRKDRKKYLDKNFNKKTFEISNRSIAIVCTHWLKLIVTEYNFNVTYIQKQLPNLLEKVKKKCCFKQLFHLRRAHILFERQPHNLVLRCVNVRIVLHAHIHTLGCLTTQLIQFSMCLIRCAFPIETSSSAVCWFILLDKIFQFFDYFPPDFTYFF